MDTVSNSLALLRVLVTGASSGIGNLTVRRLAAAGHTVYAGFKSTTGESAVAASGLAALAEAEHLNLRVIPLDVRSQAAADDAVGRMIEQSGGVDAVVHNAGHLAVGYAEAFTADEIARLLDINVLGIQRVNRAVLPHMRGRRRGTLVYVGSTTSVVVPPFLAPYVASKSAADALAAATAYELRPFGIETSIVMPGPFTRGTEHFRNADVPADRATTQAYGELDPFLARNEAQTNALFPPDIDADPQAVADEIARILALPAGQKPFRTVVDFTNAGVAIANAILVETQRDNVVRMGFSELLSMPQGAPR